MQLRKEAYTAAVVTVGMGVLHLKLALLKEGAAWESLHTASASVRRSSEMVQRMRDPQVRELAFTRRISRLCHRLCCHLLSTVLADPRRSKRSPSLKSE